MKFDDQVTVLIPTSPIPCHPDMGLIEECVGAVRHYFPDVRVVLMADGVRPEVSHRAQAYGEYLKALSDKVNYLELGRTELMVCAEHEHQARMTRKSLGFVETPLVLFVEQDAVLRREPAIEWDAIFSILLDGSVNLVRMYNWKQVPWHEHQYLMRGDLNFITFDGVRKDEHDLLGVKTIRFLKTVQFSGWPLVARTDYFKALLATIPEGQRTMIEPAVYGKVEREPWEQNKLVIYAPEDGLTFYHRDGRRDPATGEKDPCNW